MTEKIVSYKPGIKTQYVLINAALDFAKVLNQVNPYKPVELMQSGLATDCKVFLAELAKVNPSKNSKLWGIVLETEKYPHAVAKKLGNVITTDAKFTLSELKDHANHILNLQAELNTFCLSLTQVKTELAEASKPVDSPIPAKTLEAEIFS